MCNNFANHGFLRQILANVNYNTFNPGPIFINMMYLNPSIDK